MLRGAGGPDWSLQRQRDQADELCSTEDAECTWWLLKVHSVCNRQGGHAGGIQKWHRYGAAQSAMSSIQAVGISSCRVQQQQRKPQKTLSK